MATLQIERDLTKLTSEREHEEADLLMAAMINNDIDEVRHLLTENAIIRRLVERGAIRLFGSDIT